MKKTFAIIAGLTLSTQLYAAPTEQAVIKHYADLAQAKYEDSLITARQLHGTIEQLIATPNEQTLNAARTAWKAARVPYQQTEAYRFGNSIVDEWEGKVNAWPLDEGLIDYVSISYGDESDLNPYYSANIIANKTLKIGGRTVDASKISKELLRDTLHEIDEVETNVATGYHAIEFLLWGQDTNGTGPGAGNRPATDFDVKNCTNGNCDRRGDYLKAASALLVEELEWMTAQWNEQGAARKTLLEADAKQALATIFTGMGSLSYGELAGERMKLGLLVHDPEEEHDCFSDNTHYSHYFDALGISNVYRGTYTRIDGTKLNGPSVADLVSAKDAAIDKQLRDQLDTTLSKMQVLVDSAEKDGIAYDQLIGEGNKAGNAKVMEAINALLNQTKGIEKAVIALGLDNVSIAGSDSLDNPAAVEE